MGYPPNIGYPNDPYPMGGYGLTGAEAQIHDDIMRAGHVLGPDYANDEVARASIGYPDAADKQARELAAQAGFVEHHRRGMQAQTGAPATQHQPTPDARGGLSPAVDNRGWWIGDTTPPAAPGRGYSSAVPARHYRNYEWMRTFGGWIMFLSAFGIMGALVSGGLLLLSIPAFFAGLGLFYGGDSLHYRQFNRR